MPNVNKMVFGGVLAMICLFLFMRAESILPLLDAESLAYFKIILLMLVVLSAMFGVTE